MGTIIHDAIVVTSWREAYLVKARDEAERLGLPVTNVAASGINGYVSFLVAPDGSKEGWSDSDDGDRARASWIAWARNAWKADVWIEWVHVRYSRDLEGALVAGTGCGDKEDE